MKCSKLTRMISLLLALVFCLSLLPTAATAAGTVVAYWAESRDADKSVPLYGTGDVMNYAKRDGYIRLETTLVVPQPAADRGECDA